jgi:hypothetical protein
MDRGSDIGTIEPNGEVALAQPVCGDGYALIREVTGDRWRMDVWCDGLHRAVPFVGEINAHRINLGAAKLAGDFQGNEDALAKVEALKAQALSLFGG